MPSTSRFARSRRKSCAGINGAASSAKGSSRTSSTAAGDARRSADRAGTLALFRGIAQFEATQQLQDPATALYVLVCLLIALGYTSGAVELVTGRGDVPRNSPWALTLAYGGLTAFAQLISTFIAITAVLRDRAARASELLAVTGVPPQWWLAARICAALSVALVVYAAIPVGAAIGAAIGAARPDITTLGVGDALWRYGRPYLLLTVPTMIAVVGIVAPATAISGKVVHGVIAALLLVVLWMLALSLIAASSPTWHAIGALLDPFGNAPVLLETATWSRDQRVHLLPMQSGAFVAGRIVWIAIAACMTWRGARAADRLFTSDRARDSDHDAMRVHDLATLAEPVVDARAAKSAARSAASSIRIMTRRWITDDGGWRILCALGLLNAFANTLARAPASAEASQLLALVAEHSRLFLILIATIYAGELVWRDREVRIAPLVATSPVRTSTLAWAHIGALLVAEVQLVAALAVAGALAVIVTAGRQSDAAIALDGAALFVPWLLFVIALPFAQITALSLAVHAIVRHKTLAHLLLIAGWVGAVILDRRGATAWWYRFAEPAPLVAVSPHAPGHVAWMPLMQRAGYWTLVSGALLLVTAWRWPREDSLTSRR